MKSIPPLIGSSRNNSIGYVILMGIIALAVILFLTSLIYHTLFSLTENLRPWTILNPFIYGYPLFDQIIAGFVLTTIFGMVAYFLRKKTGGNVYGDAREATFSEIRKAGFFANNGVFFGRYRLALPFLSRPLFNNKVESLLAVEPPGIGKTTGIIFPTLCHYPASIAMTDLDGTVCRQTAGHRARFSNVFIFRVDGKPSHRINLLDRVRSGEMRMRDALAVAAGFFPGENDDLKHSGTFFVNSATRLAASMIDLLGSIQEFSNENGSHFSKPIPMNMAALWYLNNPKSKFIDSTGNEISSPFASFDTQGHFIKAILASRIAVSDHTSRYLARFSEQHLRMRQSTQETLSGVLDYFSDPIIQAVTETSDIDLNALRKHCTTLYLRLSDKEYSTYAPIVRSIFLSIFDNLTASMPKKNEPFTVLALLDELASLGKIPYFAQKVSNMRKFGGHVVGMLQGLNQLPLVYGSREASVLLSCFKQQIFSVCNDADTAQYISKRSYSKTSRTDSSSQSVFQFGSDKRISQGNTREALIKDYEPFVFPKDKILVFAESLFPFYAKTVKTWKEKRYQKIIKYSETHQPNIKPLKIPNPSRFDDLTLIIQVNSKNEIESESLAFEDAETSVTTTALFI